jgi:hypothetical protein
LSCCGASQWQHLAINRRKPDAFGNILLLHENNRIKFECSSAHSFISASELWHGNHQESVENEYGLSPSTTHYHGLPQKGFLVCVSAQLLLHLLRSQRFWSQVPDRVCAEADGLWQLYMGEEAAGLKVSTVMPSSWALLQYSRYHHGGKS